MFEKPTTGQQHLASTTNLDTKEEISHLEVGGDVLDQHNVLIEEALNLVEQESKMGLWQIFQMYYPGALFGLGLSLALVMEGYDTGLVSLSQSHQHGQ
jgi:SP family general alpha glucoside:H+ symporter-like MFS transporter